MSIEEATTPNSTPPCAIPFPTSQRAGHSQSVVGQVFEKFKSYIDGRLGDLAESLRSAAQDHTAEKGSIQASTKRLQRDTDAFKFKYISNAKQFVHKAEVEDLVATSIG